MNVLNINKHIFKKKNKNKAVDNIIEKGMKR